MFRHYSIILLAVLLLLVGCRTQKLSEEQRFVRSIRKELPFKVDSICLTDKSDYVEFRFANKGYVDISPDSEISPEGKTFVYRTSVFEPLVHQPDDMIWRNIVVSKNNKRVICADRYLRNGVTEGYIYVFQTESKKYPTYGTFHWDVSDSHNMEFAGTMVSNLNELAVRRLRANE